MMRKATKIRLLIGVCLVLIGCMIFGGVMAMLDWNFLKLSTVTYETNVHKVNEDFSEIEIQTITGDVIFLPSEDGTCTVSCHEQKNVTHTVLVKDGALVIKAQDTRKWYEHIGINFETAKLTVFLPAGNYGALTVETNTGDIEIPKDFCFESIDLSGSTGDIKIGASCTGTVNLETNTGKICAENVRANALAMSVTTGDLHLVGVRAGSVVLKGSTSNVSLTDVIATGRLAVETGTGDVTLDASDAAEIYIETGTGDVKGSILSEKVFIVSTGTGSKDYPDTVTGGRCEITTATGNVRIRLCEKSAEGD